MKRLLCTLLLTTITGFVNAGSVVGKVDNIWVRASDDLIFFTIKDGVASGKPACAKLGYWMIKDENSMTGKHQLSVLLAAQASQKQVQIIGFNTCTRWHDGEDVNVVKIAG